MPRVTLSHLGGVIGLKLSSPPRCVKRVKCQVSGVRCSSGYTLVELLVVLGLLAIAVGAVLMFLTSTLRGTNQTNITNELKQNGQAVLDSLERRIRSAKSAVSLSPALLLTISADAKSGVALTQADGSTFYVVCFQPNAFDNGWIGTATQAVGGAVPTLNDYIKGSETNRDTVSGINISSCMLSTTMGSTLSSDIIIINFKADRALKSPSRSDFNASTTFQTTISLRKY